jgi:hypothetical protein
MTNSVSPSGAKLKAIAHKNDTSIVTAMSLRLRERQRHTSDITRTRSELARQGERIVESDYIQFWKDLQAAGVGSIIYGRKGKPDRFEWHYSLKSVAKACIDGSNIEPIKNDSAKDQMKTVKLATKEVNPEPVKKTTEASKTVYVPLRPNFDVEFTLPVDLSKDEAEMLSRALTRAAV